MVRYLALWKKDFPSFIFFLFLVKSIQHFLLGFNNKTKQTSKMILPVHIFKQKITQEAVLGIRDIWYESGSEDPYLWLTDPDPAILVSGLQDSNQKFFFYFFFFKITFSSYKHIKQEELRFFWLFLLDDRRIRIRISY